MEWVTYLQAVSLLSLPDHTELPLALASVLPQGPQEQAALATRQKKCAAQVEEVAEGPGADSEWLEAKLLVSGAELISQQAKEFLNLRR